MLVYGLLGCLAIFHSAITFLRDAYWQDTRAFLQKGLEFAPDFYLAHHTLGRDYVKTQEYDKALAQFIHSTVLNPQFALSYNAIGVIHYLQNDLDQAIRAHERAIILDPGNAHFYNNLARTLKKKDNLFRSHLEIGGHFERKGETQEAIQQYEKSIALAGLGDKTEPLEALGLLLGQSDNFPRSLEVYRQITILDQNRSSAWVGVGYNLWHLGKLHEAADAYRKANEADTGNRKACHKPGTGTEKAGQNRRGRPLCHLR